MCSCRTESLLASLLPAAPGEEEDVSFSCARAGLPRLWTRSLDRGRTCGSATEEKSVHNMERFIIYILDTTR